MNSNKNAATLLDDKPPTHIYLII